MLPSVSEPDLEQRRVGVFICSRADLSEIGDLAVLVAEQAVPPGWSFHSVNIVWNLGGATEPLHPDGVDVARRDIPVIREFSETRIGIPYARNKALEIAQDADLTHVVFIDDDCVPDRYWLETLLGVLDQKDAEVVAGGWKITAKDCPSPWLPRTVFGTKRYTIAGRNVIDLAELPFAYTRNVAFARKILDSVSVEHRRFPESMVATGGSDTMFFARARMSGARIVYAAEAKVNEIYRDSRLTLRWHFLRRLRNTQVRLARRKETGEPLTRPRALLVPLLVVLLAIPGSLVILPLTIVIPKTRRLVGASVLQIAPFVSVAFWVMGIEYREYAGTFGFRSRAL